MVRLVARLLDESRLTPRTGLAGQILAWRAVVNRVGLLYKVEEVEAMSRASRHTPTIVAYGQEALER
jgi:hypothetical protein